MASSMTDLLHRTVTACENDLEKTFTYERHSRLHHFRIMKAGPEERHLYDLHYGGNTMQVTDMKDIQTALYETVALPKKRAYLKERFMEDLARELEVHERKMRTSKNFRRPATPAPQSMQKPSSMNITRSSTAEEVIFASLWKWVTKGAVQPVKAIRHEQQAIQRETSWAIPPETVQQYVKESEGLEDRLHQAALNAQRLQQETPDREKVIAQWKAMRSIRT